ncbi:hypothetical protein M3Y96_00604000 [Aphelenchoides besseyi]|nr:hypothetical protein M3Y96_00604000 [Aphelenchoides besseyi]
MHLLRTTVKSYFIANALFGGLGLGAVFYILYAVISKWPIGLNVLIAIKVTNISLDIGCQFHCILLVAMHETLGCRIRRCFQFFHFWRKSSITVVRPHELTSKKNDTEIYFRDLNMSWNK